MSKKVFSKAEKVLLQNPYMFSYKKWYKYFKCLTLFYEIILNLFYFMKFKLHSYN